MQTREGMTAEELLALGSSAKRTELIAGRLMVREPAGLRHGDITARISTALRVHLERERLTNGALHRRGRVLTSDPGFTIARNPDTVRAPDVAYISHERWSEPFPVGFGEFAPDLVVEVCSPSDRPGAMLQKVADWLDAGTEMVWLVDPRHESVYVYASDGASAVCGIDDVLMHEPLLPGFALPLREVFAPEA